MNDLLKKGFLLGLGAAISSKEKIEKYMDELVMKGQIAPSEAKDLLQAFIEKGEAQGELWNENAKEKIQQYSQEAGLATREEIHNLEQKLVSLEKRLEELEQNRANKESFQD